MKTLLIVYHSLTGGTRQMAEAAAAGAAAESGVAVRLLQAAAAGPGDVLAADGYIFAAPENLAALAGLMKDFFDRCYYPVLGRINGRPYGLLICAGSDGTNAARQTARIDAARWAPCFPRGSPWGCFEAPGASRGSAPKIRAMSEPSWGLKNAVGRKGTWHPEKVAAALPPDGVFGRRFPADAVLRFRLMVNEVCVNNLKHQEKHSVKHYAGLDVSVKETSICIVDETGKICRELKALSHPEDLLRVLQDPPGLW